MNKNILSMIIGAFSCFSFSSFAGQRLGERYIHLYGLQVLKNVEEITAGFDADMRKVSALLHSAGRRSLNELAKQYEAQNENNQKLINDLKQTLENEKNENLTNVEKLQKDYEKNLQAEKDSMQNEIQQLQISVQNLENYQQALKQSF